MKMAELFALIVMVFLVVAVVRLLTAPLRLALKLVVNAVCGLLALFLVNLLAPVTGVYLGLNLLNALVVGILGLPGLVLLILLTAIL